MPRLIDTPLPPENADRRRFGRLALGAAAATLAAPALVRAAELGDDGLHKQPWMLDSFLELPDDLATAAGDHGKKGLVVLFEQRGCPYCAELHAVNFADERVVKPLTENFDVLQLDLWGSREVVDLDGETVQERALARKWRVNFTPTTVFITNEPAPPGERFRLPGYFKPFHYLSGVEFVASGAYKEQNFQRYLQERFAELEAKGVTPDVW